MKPLLFITFFLFFLTACGGSGSDSKTPQDSTQQPNNFSEFSPETASTFVNIDLSKYYFPLSTSALSYDAYGYDKDNQLFFSLEAAYSETYAITNNTINVQYSFLDSDSNISILSNLIDYITPFSNMNAPRFAEVGKPFTITLNSSASFNCIIEDMLTSFSIMSDKQEANYPNYTDVIKQKCTFTSEYKNLSGIITNTDVKVGYFAKGVGAIGYVDYDCKKINADNISYLDDLNPQNCDNEFTYIEALSPKI